MKQPSLLQSLAFSLVVLGTIGERANAQTTNTITSPGFFYQVNGAGNNPPITMEAGTTHSLIINTAPNFHNVVIQTSPDTLPANRYSNAVPNDIFNGTIRVTLPGAGGPGTLYYVCRIHGFFGQINISYPIIRSLSVGPSTVVMKSTGTPANWTFVPQFSSNLTTWAPVPSYSNSLAGGTNTTTFNRLDPICGPNVYLRVNQKAP